ncbi:hypothetical protein VaNZ11_005173 [Volvox africanus]|uniref:Uncharacterized protein n=1 Tax=Volvox africanus TaxID=51714 RepID=A0ABQ5RY39_9CHLO|nr:hypothetical protein VaNZ11_005173 [Volvox africanus]
MARGCGCSKEAFRIILWMSWVTNMIVTTLYYLLSAVTFYKLLNASQQSGNFSETLRTLDRYWRAPLASCLLGALLVFGFNIFSCCILLKKSINRSGPGFGYGFMVAFCFTLAFFCLLVGLVMDSFKVTIHNTLEGKNTSWTKYSTELYVGAEVFAFICFVMFMLFFLTLVIFQGAVTDHLGINTEMNNPYVPMADPAALGLNAGAPTTDDAKAVSSTDPQFNTQYNPNDYMNNDQYNQYYSTQYNQGADAYQTTTEFNPSDYAYDQEQAAMQLAASQPLLMPLRHRPPIMTIRLRLQPHSTVSKAPTGQLGPSRRQCQHGSNSCKCKIDRDGMMTVTEMKWHVC